jgi:hypothetical protein
MQTIKLEIEDSKVDIVLNIIENLKSDVISKYEIVKQNSYAHSQEYSENQSYFEQSLKEIKNEELVPFHKGLDDLDRYIESL